MNLYPNDSKKKRMAFIMEMYDENPPENSQPPIKSVLEDLHFDVTMYIKKEQTKEKFQKYIEEIKTNIKNNKAGTECFILVLTGMSVGRDTPNEFKTRDENANGEWAADKSQNLSIWKDVMERFNNFNCAELIGVPKIFVLQLYRSPEETATDSSFREYVYELIWRSTYLPLWDDILLCHSKIEGCHPFLNPLKEDPEKKDPTLRSHFMEFLCDVLKHRGSGTDIRTVLNIVSEMLKVQRKHNEDRREGQMEFSQYYNMGFTKEYRFP